jgi:cytochrome c556
MKRAATFMLVALGACQSTKRREEAPVPLPPPAVVAQTSPVDELERLDQRKPLPLLPMMANHQKENMREHLAVVQEVVSGAATRDFAKVARSAQRIGYSEAMGQMCEHMGAGAPGFTEQALAFHHSADRIVDAAKREDSTGILTALGETLSKCTACHAAYKQKIVDR